MWAIVREVIVYSFFLWILLVISYRQRNADTFLYKDTMERVFIKNNETVIDFEKVGWKFVCWSLVCLLVRLIGLVVKASVARAEDPGFEFRLRRDFSGSSHTGNLNIGTPVATLPGAWHYTVSAGTGRPGVSVL